MAVRLTVYDIIKGPKISDKAYKLNRTKNQLVLDVHPDANKPLIKDAIEKLFNVKVEEVRTLIRKKSKSRGTARRYGASSALKRSKLAYVTLAEGYSLNLFEQVAASGEEQKKN